MNNAGTEAAEALDEFGKAARAATGIKLTEQQLGETVRQYQQSIEQLRYLREELAAVGKLTRKLELAEDALKHGWLDIALDRINKLSPDQLERIQRIGAEVRRGKEALGTYKDMRELLDKDGVTVIKEVETD